MHVNAKSYKLPKVFFITMFAFFMLGLNGCILDSFKTLTQDFSVYIDVDASGQDSVLTGTGILNLDNNNYYNDNKDRINKITLLTIAYRTTSVNPADLKGDVEIFLKQVNGPILYSETITGTLPSKYFYTPYELKLTQAEIQAINSVLASTSDRKLEATVRINNMPVGFKSIKGSIDAVFQMEYTP